MPVLKTFHGTGDEETLELTVTTAVMLRQFEEMDDDDGDEHDERDGHIYGRVNFLDIINAVLRISRSQELFRRRDLLEASYWIALRQEVYYALRKGYAPQMVDTAVDWTNVEPSNKMVLHTSQVARWLFDDGSEDGWRQWLCLDIQ